MRDGDEVVYAGGEQDVPSGTRGHVLSCTSAYAHVQWREGSVRGQVGLYSVEDLTVSRPDVFITDSLMINKGATISAVSASLDDSLEVGTLDTLASVQAAYEETGGEGLVSHLASAGYLDGYSQVAEEALQLITAQLRLDPVLRQLTSSMDPEEAEDVYRVAARTLLSDSGDF